MKALHDPDQLLAEGLAAIRGQFDVPEDFSCEVLAAAETAARRAPDQHVDRTMLPMVTLDPASSTDLDQAFAIEAAGGDLVLRYAIADVAWFVRDGDALDAEAWQRGETIYLPDGKAGLYPPVLAEGAASLLPDGNRPAVVFAVRVAPDGAARLDGVERALIRSRAKLAYETATTTDLPAGFEDLARRVTAAEAARGAARLDPPEQEVVRDGQGHFALSFRPQSQAEQRNAALSLATNMAVADALQAAHTGLFRVMPSPDRRALARLRETAHAFAIPWPEGQSLEAFQRQLDASDPRQAAMIMEVRRAGRGASYQPYTEGTRPWHAAMAATYTHATAPLRRLADRYVIRAALAVANGRPVEPEVSAAFEKLGAVMNQAGQRSAQVENAVVSLAEAVVMAGREGENFDAVVTDVGQGGARIQLCKLPVVARTNAHGVLPGTEIRVRLDQADPVRREVVFTRIG